MRIAILTQPLRTNFGGILQDYALQTVLKSLGHEPITIDYACRYPKWRWCLGKIKSIVTCSKHEIEYPHFNRAGQENLNGFIHNNIMMTKPIDAPSAEIINEINPGAIIVGSDQIWSPWANVPLDFLGNMYLDFIPEYQGKRIAYAASFGGGEWTYTQEWTEKCQSLVKKFDAVSVREDSGVVLCEQHLGIKATHVLDPTLLLTADDYNKLIPSPQKDTKTLFAYLLDITNEKIIFLNKLAKKHNLDLKVKGANDDIDWNDSVEGWLSDIRDAAMVVTDSFHGTVFSVLFHRPFLSITNSKRGADRFTSLLRQVGLSSHLVNENLSADSASTVIDWDYVDKNLSELRGNSLSFLTGAL